MGKQITGIGLSEEEFKDMIREVIADELYIFFDRIQKAKPQPEKKEKMTRKEVMEEYCIGSTTLYNLKKQKKIIPKKFGGGRRDYYFRVELDRHFK